MNIPHPKNDDLDAFQDQLHDAMKVAYDKEIKDAIVQAAQFIEDLFDQVPSSVFGSEGDTHTHLNNATATICHGVNVIVDRHA